ncbi:MAG: diguanylate cyclase [Cyanobacteria bacterium P01_F01_bin.42]
MLGNLFEWMNPSQSSFEATSPGLRNVMLGSQVLLALQQVTDLSHRHQSLSTFLNATVHVLSETISFPLVAVELYYPSTKDIVVIASTDVQEHKNQRFSIQRGDSSLSLSETVLAGDKTEIQLMDAKDVWDQPHTFPFHLSNVTVQTLIKIPLRVHQRVIGILDFAHSERIDDADQLVLWGESLASYLGSLILNRQLNGQCDSYVQRLNLLGTATRGFTYDWNLISGEIERVPDIAAVFDLPMPLTAPRMDDWLQQVYVDDRASVTELFESIWKHEGDYSLTYRVREQSDQVLTISDQGTVIRNSENEPVRVVGRVLCQSTPDDVPMESDLLGLVNTLQDSAHKESSTVQDSAREEPSLALQSTTPESQRSQIMLDNIKTVIFNTDLNGRWVYLNPAWTALTGYSVDESMGQSLIDLVASDDRQSTLDAFQTLLDGQTDFYSQEVRLLTKSGTKRWLSMEIQATLADDGQLIGTYGSFHDISDYKNTEAQLLQNALYDSLTGLPNRVLFLERLRHIYRAYRRNHDDLFTVFFLDVDSFKAINDTYGHLTGDKVLMEVADRIVACLRPGDTTARLGGDEFTVLLPQINAREDVAEIADRILDALRLPFVFDETSIQTSATIGVAVCAHPYEQPEDLLRNADMALYQAKTSGKGKYVIYQVNPQVSAETEREVESDLRRVLENKEFHVDYRPIFNLNTESMIGLEAIFRWNNPDALTQSGRIEDLVQQSGVSVSLGWKLLETACRQIADWHQKFEMSAMTLTVPLSIAQLRSPDLVTQLSSILEKQSFNPEQLRLDLVGVIEFLDDASLLPQLKSLKSLGVSLALGDVQALEPGTELASYGGRWIDVLKLDSSLVEEMERDGNLERLRAVLAMGHKFRCVVQATGVRTIAHLAQLRAFRCERGQGPLFGDSMTTAQVEAIWHDLTVEREEMSSSLISPALMMRSDTQQSQLSLFGRPSWSIGRSNDSAIVLPDRWVSRHHAELQCMNNGDVYFVDLGSGNGSYVNGDRVTMPVLLQEGDRLTVGQTDLDFVMPQANLALNNQDPSSGLTSAKTVLMMQSSKLQGEVWREALTSQGISLIWLQPNIDLVQLLEQRSKSGQPLPDLLLLDMTIIKPNPYSFCRWCGQEYDELKIILTSGSRAHVPPSERQWAINQGATDLLAAFPERNLFRSMVDVVTKVKIVLMALDIEPTDQSSLSEVLMSLRASMNRATLH